MKITSIAPWFGGKRTLAPKIIEQIGPHRSYFEPFCGSLAVLLAKPKVSYETANDLHGDVTNLARVLSDESTAVRLYDRAVRTLFTENIIYDFWRELEQSGDCGEKPNEDRAYKFFVFSWAMRNGVSGTNRARHNGFPIALRFNANNGSSTTRFRSAVESIPAWHERLRSVAITRRDAFDLLPRFDDSEELAIYADPPYTASSRSNYAASGCTSKYEHEFDHEPGLFGDDHTRLRDALARFKLARVVVSYYDDPRIRELYAGWTFVDCTMKKNLTRTNGGGQAPKEAREVLIVNKGIC